MELVKYIDEINTKLQPGREKGFSVGFVPTMGALHQGHLSLVKQAGMENDIVVVSIFVNPTQFNNPDDLKNYPRTLDADLKMLEGCRCDMVFVPDVKTIYPEPDTRIFNFGDLEQVMEGKHRPGHFTGVARVVSRFFDIIKPHKAYFGEKDFQQLAIIKKMVKDMNINVNIVPCPIIREKDGLAMSSRNALLTEEQRKAAPAIFQNMKIIAENFNPGAINTLKNDFKKEIEKSPLLKVEYIEFAEEKTLKDVNQHSENQGIRLFSAVYAGEIRLIDNLKINS